MVDPHPSVEVSSDPRLLPRNTPQQGRIPISSDLHQLEVMLGGDTGLRGGIDIFAAPPQPIGGRVGGSATSSSPAGGGDAGERTREPDGESERGTYTMFDEYGDPGELSVVAAVI